MRTCFFNFLLRFFSLRLELKQGYFHNPNPHRQMWSMVLCRFVCLLGCVCLCVVILKGKLSRNHARMRDTDFNIDCKGKVTSIFLMNYTGDNLHISSLDLSAGELFSYSYVIYKVLSSHWVDLLKLGYMYVLLRIERTYPLVLLDIIEMDWKQFTGFISLWTIHLMSPHWSFLVLNGKIWFNLPGSESLCWYSTYFYEYWLTL